MQVQRQYTLKQILWNYYNSTEIFNSLKEGIKIKKYWKSNNWKQKFYIY